MTPIKGKVYQLQLTWFLIKKKSKTTNTLLASEKHTFFVGEMQNMLKNIQLKFD